MPSSTNTAILTESEVSGIIGTGSALPAHCVTNKELEKYLDTSDEWIKDRVGISARYICDENESCLSLAAKASQLALQRAGISADDLDVIIFATITPDQLLPSAAAMLSQKIGASNSLAFDLGAACSGFVFSLVTAHSLLEQTKGKNALVVGAESLSRIVDWKDRNTAVLFGDGAGACVIRRVEDSPSPILASYMKTQSEGAHLIQRKKSAYPECSLPGTNPKTSEADDSPFMQMAGREVFRGGVRYMTESIVEVLKEANISISDIRLFIPHQSNTRMIQSVCQNVGLTDQDKIGLNIDRVGNTSAASIPIVLDEYASQDLLKPGDLILLTAVGSGMTYGSVLIRW